jgi:hypothetical protein
MGFGFAATTLLAAGLLVSTFPLLLLVAGAVFLPTSDFFSIAIVVSPGFYLTALRTTLVQAGGQTLYPSPRKSKLLKTMEGVGSSAVRASPPFAARVKF